MGAMRRGEVSVMMSYMAGLGTGLSLILAIGDRYIHLAASFIRPQGRPWAIISILIGLWLMIVGFVRL